MEISEINEWMAMLIIGGVLFLYCLYNFLKYKDKDYTDLLLAIMICTGLFGSGIMIISCITNIIKVA